MDQQRIQLTESELRPEQDDRFHRLRMIGWWDQDRLRAAKVVVIGAGALGNEIVKNLALLGVGNLFIADLDRIENSNLSRSILYRESDIGKSKAETAAQVARNIFPQVNAHFFHGDVLHDLGLGVFRWADVVLVGLDNREARLAINRACWKVGRPWIDGAIEQIQGCARVFVPDGPCYECTMSEIDWRLLQKRRSCNLLSRSEMQEGKTPTTPTISSIIAGVQCQEAVKLLHGLETIQGRGWVFDGRTADSYLVEYQRKEECYSHEILDEVVPLERCSSELTVRELFAIAQQSLGDATELELAREMLEKLVCPACGREESIFSSLGQVKAEKAACPSCTGVQREAILFHKIRGNEPFMDSTLQNLGLPPFDVVVARGSERAIGLELSGDAAEVLGPLHAGEQAVDWS